MKTRIAIITPTIYAIGGESRVVTVVANELSKKYDVTIYTCEKENKKSIYNLSDQIKVVHYYPYSKLPLASIFRFVYRKTKLSFMEEHIKILDYAYYSKAAVKKMEKSLSGKADVIIGVSGNLSILLGKSNLHNKAITIGWEHNSYEAYFNTPHKYMWKKNTIFKNAVLRLDHCVVLNEDIAKKYKENLGISCKVIYNPRSFVSCEKSNLINKQFIACGNFVEAKGFDLLIESFNKFAQVNTEWNLVIIGDGEQKNKIEDLVFKYGLSDKVSLTGYIKDIRPQLLESSVYLLSSRWEGFPMCVTEAYEVGLPMICYDIPAVLPLTQNSEGIVVEAYNVKKFADAMLFLAEDISIRRKMGENAKKMASSISIENIGEQWEKMIQNSNKR